MEPTAATVLHYRKAALAVVALHIGLGDRYVDAILSDQMDEYLESQLPERETLAIENWAVFTSLLARECILRYAATAAEGLAAEPESLLATHRVMGDTGGLGLVDDFNVLSRVQTMLAPLVPEILGDPAREAFLEAIRPLCNVYSAEGHDLVRRRLTRQVVAVAEELVLGHPLTAPQVRVLVSSFPETPA